MTGQIEIIEVRVETDITTGRLDQRRREERRLDEKRGDETRGSGLLLCVDRNSPDQRSSRGPWPGPGERHGRPQIIPLLLLVLPLLLQDWTEGVARRLRMVD